MLGDSITTCVVRLGIAYNSVEMMLVVSTCGRKQEKRIIENSSFDDSLVEAGPLA